MKGRKVSENRADEKENIRICAGKVATYYKEEPVKKKLLSLHVKTSQAAADKQELLAELQRRYTGAMLSQLSVGCQMPKHWVKKMKKKKKRFKLFAKTTKATGFQMG